MKPRAIVRDMTASPEVVTLNAPIVDWESVVRALWKENSNLKRQLSFENSYTLFGSFNSAIAEADAAADIVPQRLGKEIRQLKLDFKIVDLSKKPKTKKTWTRLQNNPSLQLAHQVERLNHFVVKMDTANIF
jgi:hypothetical protein